MKVLILGSGYLAGNIYQNLSKKYFARVAGRNTKNNSNITTLSWPKINLSVFKDIDVVIDTLGMNSDDCQKFKDSAMSFGESVTKLNVRAAIESNVKKYIFVSTVHVYEEDMRGIYDENSEPLSKHPYALSKIGSEVVLNENQHFIETSIIRCGNCFGFSPFKNSEFEKLAANNFVLQALKNRKIEINSNPSTRRNFVPIDELSQFIGFIAENKSPKLINFVNSQSFSLLDIANKIKKIYRKKYKRELPIFLREDSRNLYNLDIRSLSLKRMKYRNSFNLEIYFEKMLGAKC